MRHLRHTFKLNQKGDGQQGTLGVAAPLILQMQPPPARTGQNGSRSSARSQRPLANTRERGHSRGAAAKDRSAPLEEPPPHVRDGPGTRPPSRPAPADVSA